MKTKKVLLVFSHPDDESFGPGGTIALWAKQGYEIHLISATKGENGNNHTKKETAKIRSRELTKAAKILGIKKVTFLRFTDGCICNRELQPLMKIIKRKIQSFKPDILLTFNLNGVSGHIDHMSVASAVTKVFDDTKIAEKLYYFTESRALSDKMKHYFIYFPEGKCREEVDEVVNIEEVYEQKVAAMHAHVSQTNDVRQILKLQKNLPKEEFFMVRTLAF